MAQAAVNSMPRSNSIKVSPFHAATILMFVGFEDRVRDAPK